MPSLSAAQFSEAAGQACGPAGGGEPVCPSLAQSSKPVAVPLREGMKKGESFPAVLSSQWEISRLEAAALDEDRLCTETGVALGPGLACWCCVLDADFFPPYTFSYSKWQTTLPCLAAGECPLSSWALYCPTCCPKTHRLREINWTSLALA